MASKTTLRYGASRHEVGTLRVPEAVSPNAPLVVLVHGGFWRWPYNRWSMLLLERDLIRRGWMTCNIAYRRLGRFGGGGGWPETFDDVRGAIDAVGAHVAASDAPDRPIFVVGHSAGGHLALVAAANAERPPAAVIAMSAPTDLERLFRNGSEPVAELTQGAPADRRWSSTSPMHMLPLGVPIVCVHSAEDTTVDPAMSTSFVAAATAAGDQAEAVIVAGEAHRDALWPGSSTWSAVISSISDRLTCDVQV